MALVTLTVAQLAAYGRITVEPIAVPPQPYLNLLTLALNASTPIIEDYAGDDTPQATINLAAAQMPMYVYDKPSFTRRPAPAFRYSGAQDLLAAWHLPRQTVVK